MSKRLDIINRLAEGECLANICQEHHVQFSVILAKLKKVQSRTPLPVILNTPVTLTAHDIREPLLELKNLQQKQNTAFYW
jgi:hypothetical protein